MDYVLKEKILTNPPKTFFKRIIVNSNNTYFSFELEKKKLLGLIDTENIQMEVHRTPDLSLLEQVKDNSNRESEVNSEYRHFREELKKVINKELKSRIDLYSDSD